MSSRHALLLAEMGSSAAGHQREGSFAQLAREFVEFNVQGFVPGRSDNPKHTFKSR
jgi:hypothetical protein